MKMSALGGADVKHRDRHQIGEALELLWGKGQLRLALEKAEKSQESFPPSMRSCLT